MKWSMAFEAVFRLHYLISLVVATLSNNHSR